MIESLNIVYILYISGDKKMTCEIKVWGYNWEVLDDGICFCLQPEISGVYCGITLRQLGNIEYMKKIGMKL